MRSSAGEFTQRRRRRRRLRKRHLKSEFLGCLKLNRVYSISFNSSNLGKIFLDFMNSKRQLQSSGKEKESCVLFPSSTKREIRQFNVVVVQRRQRNVQKRSVMHVQSCCFACLNQLFFLPFSLSSPSSLRNLPTVLLARFRRSPVLVTEFREPPNHINFEKVVAITA